MAVSCDNCHQQFSRGTSVSRHIADRCLFQPEHSDDDLKLTVNDDIIHIINNQPNMYQKIQQCLMIKSSCPSVYPLIFTPKGNFSTNPSVKYLSKIGAVNRYDILSKAILSSPSGFISLPKNVSVQCNNCPEQLVLTGITKPQRQGN